MATDINVSIQSSPAAKPISGLLCWAFECWHSFAALSFGPAIGLTATLLVTGAAHAALLDRGGGMIYDTDLDITWLSDANYAFTSGYAAANARDNGFSAKDNILADGRMGWDAAVAWADGLVFGGFSDWRLPTALNADGTGPCLDINCTGSEMGHLFYNELGGNAGESILNATGDTTEEIANLALFENVQSNLYWSGTALPQDPDFALIFNTLSGIQGFTLLNGEFYAWAVRPGDAASVPEPSSLVLAALALAGIGAARRRECSGVSTLSGVRGPSGIAYPTLDSVARIAGPVRCAFPSSIRGEEW